MKIRCPVCGYEMAVDDIDKCCPVCPNCGFHSCDEWEVMDDEKS